MSQNRQILRDLPSAQATSVTCDDSLGDLSVLLERLPQVVLVGLKHHVADEQAVGGLAFSELSALAILGAGCCRVAKSVPCFLESIYPKRISLDLGMGPIAKNEPLLEATSLLLSAAWFAMFSPSASSMLAARVV